MFENAFQPSRDPSTGTAGGMAPLARARIAARLKRVGNTEHREYCVARHDIVRGVLSDSHACRRVHVHAASVRQMSKILRRFHARTQNTPAQGPETRFFLGGSKRTVS